MPTVGILTRPPEGRAWYQRLTVIGAILFAAAAAAGKAAEGAGVAPPGSTEAATLVLEKIGAFLGIIGVYRHIAN